MGTWDPNPEPEKGQVDIWHPQLKKNVACRYCCRIPMEVFSGGNWKHGEYQVKGCPDVTRGFFAEFENFDVNRPGEKEMIYIFLLKKTIQYKALLMDLF